MHNINMDSDSPTFAQQIMTYENRERESGRIVEQKHLGESERRFITGRKKKSILLEGTQAMPARPSDKDRIRVKTLG
jgi:hypothetical protein